MVVDNGSTDDTSTLPCAHAERLPLIALPELDTGKNRALDIALPHLDAPVDRATTTVKTKNSCGSAHPTA